MQQDGFGVTKNVCHWPSKKAANGPKTNRQRLFYMVFTCLSNFQFSRFLHLSCLLKSKLASDRFLDPWLSDRNACSWLFYFSSLKVIGLMPVKLGPKVKHWPCQSRIFRDIISDTQKMGKRRKTDVLKFTSSFTLCSFYLSYNFKYFEIAAYKKNEIPIEKWRLFSKCYPASDRAHREDSNVSGLASRGLLHPMFWSFLVLTIRFLVHLVMFISFSIRLRFVSSTQKLQKSCHFSNTFASQG